MAEGKTKKPAAKRKSKTTKPKNVPASSKLLVAKKSTGKPPAKSVKGGATSGGKVTTKKSSTKASAKSKSTTARKPVRKPQRKSAAQSSEAFIMPDIILPTPIKLANAEQGTIHTKREKRPVTFRQHVISIIALTILGIIALFSVTSYYFITLSYIDTHSVQPSLRKPVEYVDKAFQTSAGRLALRYPNYWEVSGIEVDKIRMQDIWNGTTQTTITIQQTEATSVVQWLKDNPPAYKNFQITQLPDELSESKGVYALADGETEGQTIQMFYFAHDTYIVSVIMTSSSNEQLVEKNTTAYYAVIKNLEID